MKSPFATLLCLFALCALSGCSGCGCSRNLPELNDAHRIYGSGLDPETGHAITHYQHKTRDDHYINRTTEGVYCPSCHRFVPFAPWGVHPPAEPATLAPTCPPGCECGCPTKHLPIPPRPAPCRLKCSADCISVGPSGEIAEPLPPPTGLRERVPANRVQD